MKIRKIVRRRGGGAVSTLNAVITANLGEPGGTSASGRQHVEIIQRDGHTEVLDHHTDDNGE